MPVADCVERIFAVSHVRYDSSAGPARPNSTRCQKKMPLDRHDVVAEARPEPRLPGRDRDEDRRADDDDPHDHRRDVHLDDRLQMRHLHRRDHQVPVAENHRRAGAAEQRRRAEEARDGQRLRRQRPPPADAERLRDERHQRRPRTPTPTIAGRIDASARPTVAQ